MDSFIKNNLEALIKGGIITLGLTMILRMVDFTIIYPGFVSVPIYVFINLFSFVLCWIFLSFLVSKFPIYKIIIVIGLLVVAMIAERYLPIQNNPITIPFLLLFWVGVAYFILPDFFKKYKIYILSAYGIVIIYYFFIFLTTPNHIENHRLGYSNFPLIPISVFAALWVYEQWRWLTILKADKAKAELALLRSQINPHFFFNTLNNLYGLAVEKSDQAPEVILKLSDMMRYTIYEGKEDWVNLSDEIKYLENYIELHKIRYQKKVNIQFRQEIEKEIPVAPLLFIILLENAFKHGVADLTEKAYINLELKTQDNQLFFTIENNYEPNTTNQKRGIGLDNLKQRLNHIYPDRHRLVTKKTNSIYSAHLTLDLDS